MNKIFPGAQKEIMNVCSKNPSWIYESNEKGINELQLYDAQTSGGLLISVSQDDKDKLLQSLKNKKCLSYNVIGTITEKKSSHLIKVK